MSVGIYGAGGHSQVIRSVLEDNNFIVPQVFDDKHGFINNLSVLDLLFNEGKFTLDYLKDQKLINR